MGSSLFLLKDVNCVELTICGSRFLASRIKENHIDEIDAVDGDLSIISYLSWKRTLFASIIIIVRLLFVVDDAGFDGSKNNGGKREKDAPSSGRCGCSP
jgi:hypothetical protein